MPDAEAIKSQIREAFADVECPGDWCLSDSNEGDEPLLLREEFTGKSDWRTLGPDFLDRAPAGFGSALSFFSLEAFRFYLPAYLIADIDRSLARVDPVACLTNYFTNREKGIRVNRRRYGDMTWMDFGRHRCSTFTQEQAAAIVAYLRFKYDTEEHVRHEIPGALQNYWLERAGLTK